MKAMRERAGREMEESVKREMERVKGQGKEKESGIERLEMLATVAGLVARAEVSVPVAVGSWAAASATTSSAPSASAPRLVLSPPRSYTHDPTPYRVVVPRPPRPEVLDGTVDPHGIAPICGFDLKSRESWGIKTSKARMMAIDNVRGMYPDWSEEKAVEELSMLMRRYNRRNAPRRIRDNTRGGVRVARKGVDMGDHSGWIHM